MVLHPEIVHKAQEELDSVVGSDRLPQLSDREKLPYIEGIVQETLRCVHLPVCLKYLIRRWYPVVPLGLPHRSLKDEVYRNMLIPKGSTIFANLRSADFTCVESSKTISRGMSLDEKIYKDPEAFNPDRFVAKLGYTPEPFFPSAFGFGRRFDSSFIRVL